MLTGKKRALAVTATLCAAALGLAACVTDEPEEKKTKSSDAPVEEAIAWEDCDVTDDAQCATVQAPLDWEDPDGETIDLALARVRASGDDRLGSLLINPGGPGGSGVEFLSQAVGTISESVKERYDIVGFDPRGVGDSSAVTCYTETSQLDDFWAATWPSTPDGYESSAEVVEPFVASCDQNTGPLLGHVDTVSAAKDLDLLRDLLGDEQLNLLGYSYGTFLGATYAELFPENVGRFVLDGAVDPSVPEATHEVEQAAGFQAALEAYLDDCLGTSSCPFDGTKQAALDRIHQMLLDIEASPPSVGQDGRKLTVPLALNGIFVTLYDDSSWMLLSGGLDAMINDLSPAPLMELSDFYLDRTQAGYKSNMMVAFLAINCLDDRSPSDLASVEAHSAQLRKAAPTFGEFWGYSEKLCELWPYPATGAPHEITAPGAGPIVVIGTTGDPATPYHGAVALAEALESGVLITFDGEGHTAYGRSNDCVGDAVDEYFLSGTAPEADLSC